MEAMNAENAARVETATLAALLDGDGDGEAAPPAGATTDGADAVAPVTPVVVPALATTWLLKALSTKLSLAKVASEALANVTV